MPCKRLQPSYRSSANSLTFVPTGPLSTSLLEIAKPLFLSPRNRKGFRPSVEDSFRSFLFVVTACRNGREVSLPQKGATEATSCPKGGNIWRHWYGLAQAWGSTTYDWTLGQILPRSREEGCQQNLKEALSQGRHGFTVRETLPWKNTHMGLPEGESGHTDT